MTRATQLTLYVVIRWVVLTLSHRQANFCLSMPQPWPWVKVMERSSITFPQTHIFFAPNIKGLDQTVLTWEGKVFADADAAETNWKHKVTPDWGDLKIISILALTLKPHSLTSCFCNNNDEEQLNFTISGRIPEGAPRPPLPSKSSTINNTTHTPIQYWQ